MWYRTAQFNYIGLDQDDIKRLNGYVRDGIDKGLSVDMYISRGLLPQDQQNPNFINNLRLRWAAELNKNTQNKRSIYAPIRDPFARLPGTGNIPNPNVRAPQQQGVGTVSGFNLPTYNNYNTLTETPLRNLYRPIPPIPQNMVGQFDPVYLKPDYTLGIGNINYNPPVEWLNKIDPNRGFGIIKDGNGNWWKIILRPDVAPKKWVKYPIDNGQGRMDLGMQISPPTPVQTLYIPQPKVNPVTQQKYPWAVGTFTDADILKANGLNKDAEQLKKNEEIKTLTYSVNNPDPNESKELRLYYRQRLEWLLGKRAQAPQFTPKLQLMANDAYNRFLVQHPEMDINRKRS